MLRFPSRSYPHPPLCHLKERSDFQESDSSAKRQLLTTEPGLHTRVMAKDCLAAAARRIGEKRIGERESTPFGRCSPLLSHQTAMR